MGTLPPDQEAARVKIATDNGMHNAQAIADASQKAGVPYHVALAFAEQESHGQNIYGHDTNGLNPGQPVTAPNFCLFYARVFSGETSNGVGPYQITYPGYFTDMLHKDLRPWVPEENAFYALFYIIKPLLAKNDLVTAAGHYNGGSKANMTYGRAVASKDAAWKKRFGL